MTVGKPSGNNMVTDGLAMSQQSRVSPDCRISTFSTLINRFSLPVFLFVTALCTAGASDIDNKKPPGAAFLDIHVPFPLEKVLSTSSRSFRKGLDPDVACTSGEGPYCFQKLLGQEFPQYAATGPAAEPNPFARLFIDDDDTEEGGKALQTVIIPELVKVMDDADFKGFFTPKRKPKLLVAYYNGQAEAEQPGSGPEPPPLSGHKDFLNSLAEGVAVLATAGVKVLTVDCSNPELAKTCSAQAAESAALPDLRFYRNNLDLSVRFPVAAAGDKVATDVWTVNAVVSYLADKQMQRMLEVMSMMATGLKQEGKHTVVDMKPNEMKLDLGSTDIASMISDTLLNSGIEDVEIMVADESGAKELSQFMKDLTQLSKGERGEGEGESDEYGKLASPWKKKKPAPQQVHKQNKRDLDLKHLISKPNGAPRLVEFKNHLSRTVKVNWVDFKGAEQLYLTMRPGEQQKLSSYAGHAWVIRDSGTNKVLAVAVVDEGEGTEQIVFKH